MARIYDKGRPTTGWHKGERITRPEQMKTNDVLIGVSHQFKAENLYVAIPSPDPESPHQDDGFYVRYAQPDLKPTHTDFQPQWVWIFELEQNDWYKAVQDGSA
jgi:hypothetical protein